MIMIPWRWCQERIENARMGSAWRGWWCVVGWRLKGLHAVLSNAGLSLLGSTTTSTRRWKCGERSELESSVWKEPPPFHRSSSSPPSSSQEEGLLFMRERETPERNVWKEQERPRPTRWPHRRRNLNHSLRIRSWKQDEPCWTPRTHLLLCSQCESGREQATTNSEHLRSPRQASELILGKIRKWWGSHAPWRVRTTYLPHVPTNTKYYITGHRPAS